MEELKNIDNEFSMMDDEILKQPAPGEQVPEEAEDIQEPAEPESVNNPELIADMVYTGLSEIFPLYPSLEKIYTPERCLDLATKVCAVADKHGFDMLGFLAKYIEEIMLGFSLVKLWRETYIAIDHDMREKAKQKKAEDEASQMKEAA